MTDEIWLETDHPYFNKDLDCVWGDYVSIGITNTNGFSVEYLLNRTSAQNGETTSINVDRETFLACIEVMKLDLLIKPKQWPPKDE